MKHTIRMQGLVLTVTLAVLLASCMPAAGATTTAPTPMPTEAPTLPPTPTTPPTVAATPTPAPAESIAQSQLQRVSSPNVANTDLQTVVAGNSSFAFDLYRALRAERGNLFFSPYSISTALAMTYAGARGETERQMAAVLHFTLPQERLHPALNALDLAVTRPSEADDEFRLNVANSLWGQQGYTFLPEFLDLLAQNYGAGLRLVDFKSAPEPARLAINRWVSDQTEDKIKDLIPEGGITNLTRLVLANAIYFDAKWVYPFDKESTQDGTFHLLDGGQVDTPMMRMDRPAVLRYVRGVDYQAAELPYVGDRASMVIIVPDAGSFADFEATLNADRVNAIVAGMQPKTVALTLPKFSYASEVSLVQTLAAMGMPDATDPQRADFSGMDGTRNLYISDVFHKAFVAVDEAGTEAAAATAIVVGVTSAPQIDVELTVDHPFIFLIRDNSTGSILFLGRVLDPTK